jgi:hypothetical protein
MECRGALWVCSIGINSHDRISWIVGSDPDQM